MPTRELKVHIAPHDRTIVVPQGRSVLEAALAAGLNLPHSCKSGHCASCRARLLSGEIRYPNGRPLGITAAEERQGEVLLCQARPVTDLRVEARLIASVEDVEIKTLPCRIAKMTPLAPDVMQVFLRLPAVEPLRFKAGQYLDVLLEGGRRRSFSIASPPHDSELVELHVRRVLGGGFTEAVFTTLHQGSLLRIEGPLGQFVYRERSAPALLIAGGTGFAPLKSMLRHALENGSTRDVTLYWGARTPIDVYEEALVLEWQHQYPNLRFAVVLSEADASQAAHHRLGWVHEAVLADHPSLAAFDVYAAGPPAMIEAIRASFPARGVDDDRLHFDSFDYAPA
ncbi:MAG TPA: 2Fe-2S iron-sulfur cluster-binding protein [Steroidobacteraceae bacterium]|nr:2Fe-2S iron-sulfur cluster-binding protein [Steroidobacteraceae bacterium]